MKINLLDTNLGIQNVMDFEQAGALPKAENLATSVLYEAGLEDLYAPNNYAQLIEESLSPSTGDGHILRAEVFSQNIGQCLEKMANSDNNVVREAVQQELRPLQENKDLLQAYCGLMIGG